MSTVPLVLVALLGGCECEDEDRQPAVDTGEPPGDASADCEDGWIDDRGTCVPEACGVGPWGDLEVDEDTVFVRAGASRGNGTEAAPFNRIQLGLDAAAVAGGRLVAVAEGTYPEKLRFGTEHAGVRLAGRCRDLVVVDASTGDVEEGWRSGLKVNAGEGAVEISGITVARSIRYGISIVSGNVSLSECSVVDCDYTGLSALYSSYITDSTVTVSIQGCEFMGNGGEGVSALGERCTLSLQDSVIRDTLPNDTSNAPVGLRATMGCSVEAARCRIDGNESMGVWASNDGTSVSVSDCILTGFGTPSGGYMGNGAYVEHGASLVLDTCMLEDNIGAGVEGHDVGTQITLRDTTIKGTLEKDPGLGGLAALVMDGCRLSAEHSLFERNTMTGLLASGTGTRVTLTSSVVQDTTLDEETGLAVGVAVEENAWLWASDSVLSNTFMGAQAEQGGRLTFEQCQLVGHQGAGVTASGAGTEVTLLDTLIRDIESLEDGMGGQGIAIEEGATLLAIGGMVSRSTGAGLLVNTGGLAELHGVTIRDTWPYSSGESGCGVQAGGGAALHVESCDLMGNSMFGLYAEGPGTMISLDDTRIQDTRAGGPAKAGVGAQAHDGAALGVVDCEIQRNIVAGIIAGADSSVNVRNSLVTDTLPGQNYIVGVGVIAQEGAQLDVTDSTLTSNQGPGLQGAMSDTLLTVTGTRIEDNQFAGVFLGGAELIMSDSTIQGTTAQPDLGGGYGLYAAPVDDGSSPTVALHDNTIRDNPIAGIWLGGQGSYEIVGNTIHGGPGWTRGSLTKCGDAVYAEGGTQAWDGTDGLLLEDNDLSEGLTAGLFLNDSSATLLGNHFTDNTVDLVRQGEACTSAPEGDDIDSLASAELCPVYDYGVCADTYTVILQVDEIDDSRSRAGFVPPPLDLTLPQTLALSFGPHVRTTGP